MTISKPYFIWLRSGSNMAAEIASLCARSAPALVVLRRGINGNEQQLIGLSITVTARCYSHSRVGSRLNTLSTVPAEFGLEKVKHFPQDTKTRAKESSGTFHDGDARYSPWQSVPEYFHPSSCGLARSPQMQKIVKQRGYQGI